MKTILVPTDFSKNAEHAMQYAVMLAKKIKANLLLLHAYHISFGALEVPASFLMEEMAAVEKIAGERLKKMCDEIFKKTRVKCTALNVQGLAVDEIISAAKDYKVNMVVMGTKGASGIKEMLVGSNTSRVMSNAACPVIAVPERSDVAPIKKITYATNYDSGDIASLKNLVEIAKPFKAQVNVLHVDDGEYTSADEKEYMENFIKRTNKKITYNNLSYEMLKGKQIEKKLEQYIKQKGADLMVTSTHHRSLLDKLFSKSITKKLAFHTSVPLMTYHITKQPGVFI
jgi:nucleotide-binding universal stress UspA family protein